MIKNVRLIGFDLDGTLLTSDKRITEFTKRMLKMAIEQGVEVLPATGRPLGGIPQEILDFPGIRYAVTANGARIMDIKENKPVYENLLSVETASRVLDVFEQYDALREMNYGGIGYAEERVLERIGDFFSEAPMADYMLSTRVPIKNVREKLLAENRSVDKLQAVFADVEAKNRALRNLHEIKDIEVTGALTNNIEVNAKGVNKGKSLLHLGSMLGIAREEIMAFGDGANDLDMMIEAGCGVAMENATDEIKAAADFVTVSNDNDGVAKVIEKYVLR